MSAENKEHVDSIQIPIELPTDLIKKIELAIVEVKKIAQRSPVPPHANCKGGVPPESKINVYRNVSLDEATGKIVFEITATAACPNVGKCHTWVIWKLDPVKRVFFDENEGKSRAGTYIRDYSSEDLAKPALKNIGKK